MRLSLVPSRNKRLAYTLYAVAACLLAGSLTVAAIQPATADAADWGPDGTTGNTSSAVTVQWDNGGATPAADQVPRDSTQILPHTGGKTYADVNPALSAQMQQTYGGASLTVSQTADLVHQAVTLTVSGAVGGSNQSLAGFTIMQCWGSSTEAQPDPEDCQDGAGVLDTSNLAYLQAKRGLGGDDETLTAGGDLKAATHVTLGAVLSGTTATLTAQVIAAVNGTNADVGDAAGSIVFTDANGNTVARVAVSNGLATTTVKNVAATATFDAQYIAAATANYLDSPLVADASNADQVTFPDHTRPLPVAPSGPLATNAAPHNTTQHIPFRAVSGDFGISTAVGGFQQFYSSETTNEIGDLTNGSEPFEMQTGAESPGLGCGARSDQPSTSVCWLVAVPANFPATAGFGNPPTSPLTPSLWAQRMQVRLNFADVATSCGSGARELSVGSELLVDAMNSWIPALCTQTGVDLGYIQTDDESARGQLASGGASLVFTSQPVDDSGGGTSTLYGPAGLSAVNIAVLAATGGTNEFVPLKGIKLNARLVAKLLTESYREGIDPTGASSSSSLPWAMTLPAELKTDPEFQALNPGLPNSVLGNDLVVTVAGSDGTSALWNWITSDPDARAFLDGCPDAASNNTVINPFYSTRTYAECKTNPADTPAQQALESDALEKTAASYRSAQSASNPMGTVLPSTYTDSVPSYPPAGGVFPQPGYYERPAVTDASGSVTQLADGFANLHPHENSFSIIAGDVLRGQEKSLTLWCSDPVACPGNTVTAPGIWLNGTPPLLGTGVFGLTDGTAAAHDTLPTTLLCDDSGDNCVGANNASLTAAAGKFTSSSTDSHFESLDASAFAKDDWYADGAYPLTVPVYAEINTVGLSQATAQDYAKVLQYISTTGQQQGFDIGNLPPGMAPLTDSLVAQDQAAIATLKQIRDPAVSAPPAPTSVTGQQLPASSNGGAPAGEVPPVSIVPVSTPVPNAPAGSSLVPTSAPQALPGATALTPALPTGPYAWGVGGGLAGALASGVAAPIVGRKRKAGVL